MTDEATKLTGDELNARAAELNIAGRSDMTADEKRDAIARAEAGDTSVQEGGDTDTDTGDEDAAAREASGIAPSDRDRDAAEKARAAEEDVERSPTDASIDQNAELEHTEGGETTRDDRTDQGVPMLQGDPNEPIGPEDAAGRGEKRGDYEGSTLASVGAHEAVRVDGGTGDAGPLEVNEDGGVSRAPHTVLEPQAPRMVDQGEVAGKKGGVDTDPRSS